MPVLAWVGTGLFAGAIIGMIILLARRGRRRGYSRPVERIQPRAYQRMGPRAIDFDGTPEPEFGSDGEPIGRGPSPELLSRMEAAGMNTTHETWDEFEADRKKRDDHHLDETREEDRDD